MEGKAEAGGAGGAGRGAAMEHSAGETADAARSSDDALVKQAARLVFEHILPQHTTVISDERYRSILLSLLRQSRVAVPSQDLQEFPLTENDRKNAIWTRKLQAEKDSTCDGYEYNGERYVVRSQKEGGRILLPASMVFEVVFRMFSAGARTEKKLRQGVKSSHVVACIVIDDFMRVMRMCYQVLTCEPPREMK